MDDELDIENDDEDEFGEAQFNEGDIINPDSNDRVEGDDDIDMEPPSSDPTAESLDALARASNEHTSAPPARSRTLQDLVAAGKIARGRLDGKGKGKPEDAPLETPPLQITNVEDIDVLIVAATASGDKDTIITLLQRKVLISVSSLHSLARAIHWYE